MDSGSARGRLLGRARGRHDERASLASEGDGIEARAGRGPELGSELEIAVRGPMGHDAEDISEIGLCVEAVQFAGGEEREESGRGPTKTDSLG